MRVKTEPDQFKKIKSKDGCFACVAGKIGYSSEYPSLVEPFTEETVFYCNFCGTGFVLNARDMLNEYYISDYANTNRGDRNIDPKKYFSEDFRKKSKKLTRYFGRSSRHLELLKDFGVEFNDILDYGSGPGYGLFLSQAKRKYAFEPDEESKKYLKYIKAKRLEKLEDISKYKYDGIIASHSIEHLAAEDLESTLRVLLNSLKDNGKFLIEVPQAGHSFLHLDSRQDPHTIFFTPQGIVEAVERAGGRVLYHKAFSKTPAPLRKKPIYKPVGKEFFSEQRGALTVVCEKA